VAAEAAWHIAAAHAVRVGELWLIDLEWDVVVAYVVR
jgi:hypothetical protein